MESGKQKFPPLITFLPDHFAISKYKGECAVRLSMSFLLFLVSCAVCTAIMCAADWNGDLVMKAKAKWYCLLRKNLKSLSFFCALQIRFCSEAVCGMSSVHRQVSDCKVLFVTRTTLLGDHFERGSVMIPRAVTW
ncbi:hypothetical protein NC652_003924 [Populus alba x Populus x berolinensis]|nr:hypothetical protein NC652_003924 [Populus alba x Populus x berolinensis]